MAKQKSTPKEKNCQVCGGLMIQPRWANGKLDSTFSSRMFCSIKCTTSFRLKNPSQMDAAGRKRAQRLFNLKPCEKCGSARSQRHHKDRNPANNSAENIEFLCQRCHALEHIQAGDWGRPPMPTKICEICKAEFQPRKKARKLCGKLSCSKEKGRQSAERRWGSKTE